MRMLAVFTSAVCALLIGCTDSSDNTTVTTDPSASARTSTVSYVCIGMETSSRFGSCPGCTKDADRINGLLKDTFGYSGVLLQSAQATRDAVVGAVKSAISATPEDGLFILYYSGHGGREFLDSTATEEPEGADEADEYLCLYDKALLDDDVWRLITQCRGRVFLVFDCCHSQTMFRSVASDEALEKGLAIALGEENMVKSTGFTLRPRGVPLSRGGEIKMLCWSGCMEAEYSYGSSRGGVMTNAIMSRWRKGVTYADLWSAVAKDVTKSQSTQHPMSTQYGGTFVEAFR